MSDGADRLKAVLTPAAGAARRLVREGLSRAGRAGRSAWGAFQAAGGFPGLWRRLAAAMDKLKPHVIRAAQAAKRYGAAAWRGVRAAASAAAERYRRAGGNAELRRRVVAGAKHLRPAARAIGPWIAKAAAACRSGAARAQAAFRAAGGFPGLWRRIRPLPAYVRAHAVPTEGATGLVRQASRVSNLWRSGRTGRICLISASGVVGAVVVTVVLVAVFSGSSSRRSFSYGPSAYSAYPSSRGGAADGDQKELSAEDVEAIRLMQRVFAEHDAMVDPMSRVNRVGDQMQRRRAQWAREREQRNRAFAQRCYDNAQHELNMAEQSLSNGNADAAEVETDSADRWKALGDSY